jgi:hypothetical protein
MAWNYDDLTLHMCRALLQALYGRRLHSVILNRFGSAIRVSYIGCFHNEINITAAGMVPMPSWGIGFDVNPKIGSSKRCSSNVEFEVEDDLDDEEIQRLAIEEAERGEWEEDLPEVVSMEIMDKPSSKYSIPSVPRSTLRTIRSPKWPSGYRRARHGGELPFHECAT